MQHVQEQVSVQNVTEDISWHQLLHVQHVQVKKIVRHVLKQQTPVQNVRQDITQVELDVLPVPQKDVQLVVSQMENAQLVQVEDI